MLRKHKSPKSDMKPPKHNLKSHMAIKTRKKKDIKQAERWKTRQRKLDEKWYIKWYFSYLELWRTYFDQMPAKCACFNWESRRNYHRRQYIEKDREPKVEPWGTPWINLIWVGDVTILVYASTLFCISIFTK